MTLIVPPEYEDHSTEVEDWEDYTSIWEQLSNFWDLTVNKGLITVFWKAWGKVEAAMRDYLEHHQYDFSFHSDSYANKRAPFLRELTFGDDNRVPDTLHSYFVDDDIRYIISLKNFIQNPSLVYFDAEDSPSALHSFHFSTDVLTGNKGIITFNDNDYKTFARTWSDGNYRLWASYIYKRNEEVINKFGPFVDYSDKTKKEVESINALNKLIHSHEMGPSISSIESALYVYCDWPYATQSGTITALGDSYLTITSIHGVEKIVYNPLNDPFKQRDENGNWTPIKIGDKVIIYEPLAHVIKIEDIFTDPSFWAKVGLGSNERYHTFSVLLNGDTSDTTGSYYDLTKILRLLDRLKPIGDKPHVLNLLFNVAQPNAIFDATSYSPILLAPEVILDNSFSMGVETIKPSCSIETTFITPINISTSSTCYTTFITYLDTPVASICITSFDDIVETPAISGDWTDWSL